VQRVEAAVAHRVDARSLGSREDSADGDHDAAMLTGGNQGSVNLVAGAGQGEATP
jgi:hypothetical protein